MTGARRIALVLVMSCSALVLPVGASGAVPPYLGATHGESEIPDATGSGFAQAASSADVSGAISTAAEAAGGSTQYGLLVGAACPPAVGMCGPEAGVHSSFARSWGQVTTFVSIDAGGTSSVNFNFTNLDASWGRGGSGSTFFACCATFGKKSEVFTYIRAEVVYFPCSGCSAQTASWITQRDVYPQSGGAKTLTVHIAPGGAGRLYLKATFVSEAKAIGSGAFAEARISGTVASIG